MRSVGAGLELNLGVGCAAGAFAALGVQPNSKAAAIKKIRFWRIVCFIFSPPKVLLLNTGRGRAAPHFNTAEGFHVSHFVIRRKMRVINLNIFELGVEARILIVQM